MLGNGGMLPCKEGLLVAQDTGPLVGRAQAVRGKGHLGAAHHRFLASALSLPPSLAYTYCCGCSCFLQARAARAAAARDREALRAEIGGLGRCFREKAEALEAVVSHREGQGRQGFCLRLAASAVCLLAGENL